MRGITAFTLGVCFMGAGFGQEIREASTQELSQRVEIAKDLKAGEYSNAERVFREVLGPEGAAEGISAGGATDLRNGLGDLLREEGREREARALFNKVLSSPDITWKQRLVATMGLAGMDGHDFAAEPDPARWMAALAMAREHGDIVSEASSLRGLATLWFEAGAPSRAEPLLRRSLQLLENNGGAPGWEMGSTLAITGQVYRALDKLALAEHAYTHALEVYRATFGEMHPQTAYIIERLAEIYAMRKNFTLARQYSGRAVGIMRQACGEDSLAVANAFASQGNVEEWANSLPAALDSYATALRIARNHPDNRVIEAAIMRHYARLLKASHKEKEAHALVAEARSFQQQSLR